MPLGEVSAVNGGAAIGRWAQSVTNRAPADVPQAMLEASDERSLYVFNVGPWPQVRLLGSMGRVTIQGCPPDKPYSEPYRVPGIPMEQYPVNETQMGLMTYDGPTYANEIIGVGPNRAAHEDLRRVGLFISKGPKPTRDELAEANRRLDQYCLDLIAEANALQAEDPRAARDSIQPARHHWAANRMKKTPAECSWLAGTVEQAQRMECPFCGWAMHSHLSKCPNCKEIVNQAAYAAATLQAKGG